MNERLKELRKILTLTQEGFAERLGIKRNTLANYEIGRNEPIDAVVSLICREFSVNEHWLRTGEGEMFIKDDDSLLNDLATKYNMSEKQKKIIAAFAAMNDKKRDVLAEAFFEFIDLVSAAPEIAATVPPRPAASDKKLTRAQKEELMKQQLDLEEKMAASASTTTNGLDGGKLA